MSETSRKGNEGDNADGPLPTSAVDETDDGTKKAELTRLNANLGASFFRSKNHIRSYYRMQASSSPSIQPFEPVISSKLAEAKISANAGRGWTYIGTTVLFIAYEIFVLGAYGESGLKFLELYLVGFPAYYLLLFFFDWIILRSRQEYLAMVWLFSTICLLERSAARWPTSEFRWQIARHLERIARYIERIPLASKALAPTTKQEAFRMSRARAQTIRELELWAIHPQAFTFTDLIEKLTVYLRFTVNDRWYDLPAADTFKIERSKWTLLLPIGGAVAILGTAIIVAVFAKRIGPAASVLTVILPALAVAALNSAGISSSVIDRYIQTGSKVMPGK